VEIGDKVYRFGSCRGAAGGKADPQGMRVALAVRLETAQQFAAVEEFLAARSRTKPLTADEVEELLLRLDAQERHSSWEAVQRAARLDGGLRYALRRTRRLLGRRQRAEERLGRRQA
jgi:hypothetical protein